VTVKAGDLVRIREEEEIMLVVDMFALMTMVLCLRGGKLQYIPKDLLEAIG